MARVVVITGGNMGDVADRLKTAARMIALSVGQVIAVSEVHRSQPWGDVISGEDGGVGDFLNQVLVVETDMEPERLLDSVQEIERQLGRERAGCEVVNDLCARRMYRSRTMDIDILFYENMVVSTDRLTIPHQMIAQRLFVLIPLAEVLPDLRHPVLDLTVAEMLENAKKQA